MSESSAEIARMGEPKVAASPELALILPANLVHCFTSLLDDVDMAPSS